MAFEVRPLHPLFVGAVSGIDVDHAVDPRAMRAMWQAIDRYAVLVSMTSGSTDAFPRDLRRATTFDVGSTLGEAA